jgi:hypothetical protein
MAQPVAERAVFAEILDDMISRNFACIRSARECARRQLSTQIDTVENHSMPDVCECDLCAVDELMNRQVFAPVAARSGGACSRMMKRAHRVLSDLCTVRMAV